MAATVESENELIQVGLEVFHIYPMMNSQEPRFEVSENLVNMGSQLASPFGCCLHLPEMIIAFECPGGIAFPPITSDGAPLSHIATQEEFDLFPTGRPNLLKAKPSRTLHGFPDFVGQRSNFHSAHHQRGVRCFGNPSSSVAFGGSPNMRFIGFHYASKRSTVRPHHPLTQAVQKEPRTLILGNSQLPLQLHRANAGSVRSHPISSPKPNSQGKVGIVHQSSS